MARVLITGITGQDGSYLAEACARRGDEVFGLVRPGDSTLDDYRALGVPTTFLEADLEDAAGLRRAIDAARPDEVYHLAGMSSVAASWADPVKAGLVSGVGAVALMTEAIAANPKCRILLASSGEVFAGIPQERYDEASAIAPTNPYGAAKAYAHLSARILRDTGAFVAVAVLFNHESPRRPDAFVTRKITVSAARVARGLDSQIRLGNLDAKRDWGWAPDYVDAMMRILGHDHADEFVLATGTPHSVRDFARAALVAAGVVDPDAHIATDPAFERAGDAPLLVGDASRARRVLGWEPTKAFDELVAAMVEADLAILDGTAR